MIIHALANEVWIHLPVGKLDFFTMQVNFPYVFTLLQGRFDLPSSHA
jgi:hypothetical protein